MMQGTIYGRHGLLNCNHYRMLYDAGHMLLDCNCCRMTHNTRHRLLDCGCHGTTHDARHRLLNSRVPLLDGIRLKLALLIAFFSTSTAVTVSNGAETTCWQDELTLSEAVHFFASA
jgi:hypothetical protein